MERKKRSKGRGWESCYVKKIYGTFGVQMRAYGQKLVKFCTHTHTRLSYSSIDEIVLAGVDLGGIPLSRAPQFFRRNTSTVIRPDYQLLPRFGDLILGLASLD